MEAIAVIVNGKQQRITAPPDQPLLWVLRDHLQLIGTKYGCGEGQCGACTVLLEGKPVRSCLTPVAAAAGKHVVTVEGLEQNGALHALGSRAAKSSAREVSHGLRFTRKSSQNRGQVCASVIAPRIPACEGSKSSIHGSQMAVRDKGTLQRTKVTKK